jgi:methionine-rich copper-binding protein CopC
MITSTRAVHHPCVRTFVACLIISLLVLSPLAPLAPAASRSSSTPGASLPPAQPAPPVVPSISATKVDSFPDVDGDGKAAPGETITYDVNITNNGTDATNVNFSDTIDPNTTLVGGSLKVSPLAFADTFNGATDTQLVVGAPGVLANDTGIPDPTAVAIAGGATAQGGTVTLNTDGGFTYDPAPGFTGTDSFNYTVTNGLTPNDTAQVAIVVDAAPSVTATTPTNGAVDQPVNTNISITFSEPVNVTGNWFQIVCATSGTFDPVDTVVSGGPTTFTINPNSDFASNETCTVTVFAAQVSDQDTNDPPDNMTANFVFSFTTQDAAPTVTATTPANGAINQATNTNITVTFSEPVNVGATWFQIVCTSSATRNVSDTVVTGGPTIFTINPNVDFTAAETCTVTIAASQVTDQDSNDPPDQMAANFVFSFSMDAAPSVNATTPVNGATQVANNTNITVTFSEPVAVTGDWFQIVCASSGTRNPADTLVSGGPTTFTINPNTDFTNGELCTVTVFAAQVSDEDANDPPQNMAANFVFSFTIDQAPSVTLTNPTNGSIDNLKTTNIVVTFSENVNATASSFTIECPAASGPRAFGVTGSGTNVITLDPTLDLPQGTVCTVTVIANQISDTDAGDPPDNMDADFVFSFGVKPEAVDDARNATGNIRIQTAGRSGFTVLTNDISGLPVMVTASDSTSARGGEVAVAADGTFSYNPPAGYEGPDSFNYTISNPAVGSDVGTVNLTVAGMIWFIDDNPVSGACTTNNNICGRLTHPFSTLASFEAVNGNPTPTNGADVIAPEAGDHIFIFSGSYTGPLSLEANQRVISQGASQSLQALSGITPATDSDSLPSTGGAKPIITTTVTSGQNGINLSSNNQLHALQFSNTDGAAIRGAVNVGTLPMTDIVINNTGGGGIILTNGGTATISGTNSIVTTTGTALNFTNTNIGAAGLTFVSISSNGGSNSGIILDNTGAAGGLTVNGDGANTAVGGNASGGTIANKSGADGSTSTGIGIYLNNTASVVLRRMTINGTIHNFGIRGLIVNNFTLEYSTVNGTLVTAATLAAPIGAGEGFNISIRI